MLDHILPVRGVVESAQVGLELAAENLESGTLADTVGSHQTENVAGPRHGQTVELEAVGGITVGDLALEVRGQVDNGDGAEWAAFRADTATNTQLFRDEGNTRFRSHLRGTI